MTRAEAIVYFSQFACDFAAAEGEFDARGEHEEAAWHHATHTRYENCIRWLLGVRRTYQE